MSNTGQLRRSSRSVKVKYNDENFIDSGKTHRQTAIADAKMSRVRHTDDKDLEEEARGMDDGSDYNPDSSDSENNDVKLTKRQKAVKRKKNVPKSSTVKETKTAKTNEMSKIDGQSESSRKMVVQKSIVRKRVSIRIKTESGDETFLDSQPNKESVSKRTQEPVHKRTQEPVSKPTQEPVSKLTQEPVAPSEDTAQNMDFEFEVLYKCKYCQFITSSIDELRNHTFSQHSTPSTKTVAPPTSVNVTAATTKPIKSKAAKSKEKVGKGKSQPDEDAMLDNLAVVDYSTPVTSKVPRKKRNKDKRYIYEAVQASEQRVANAVKDVMSGVVNAVKDAVSGVGKDLINTCNEDAVTPAADDDYQWGGGAENDDDNDDFNTSSSSSIAPRVIKQEPEPEASVHGQVEDLKTIKARIDRIVDEIRAKALTRDAYSRVKNDNNKPHKCGECGQGFLNKQALNGHVWRRHSGENPKYRHLRSKGDAKFYKCPKCGKHLDRPGMLAYHIATEHEKIGLEMAAHMYNVDPSDARRRITIHKCDFCNYITPAKCKLDLHLATHTGEKNYQCDECGKRFTQKKSVRIHKLYKHSDRKRDYACKVCGKKFIVKHNMDQHMDTHTKLRKVMCDICGGTYASNSALKQHTRQNHLREINHKCPHCPFMTFGSAALKAHMISKHGAVSEHKCVTCGRCFPRRQLLLQHMSGVHKQVIPGHEHVSCDQCGKVFVLVSQLRRHYKQVHKRVLDTSADDKSTMVLNMSGGGEQIQPTTRRGRKPRPVEVVPPQVYEVEVASSAPPPVYGLEPERAAAVSTVVTTTGAADLPGMSVVMLDQRSVYFSQPPTPQNTNYLIRLQTPSAPEHGTNADFITTMLAQPSNSDQLQQHHR